MADGPARFPQGSSCPAVLRSHLKEDCHFEYGALTLFGRPFHAVLLTLHFPLLTKLSAISYQPSAPVPEAVRLRHAKPILIANC